MNKVPGKRLTAKYKLPIASSVEIIFPLICPVEELKWINGWKYDLLYSESGKNENNCIFAEYMTGPHFLGKNAIEPTIWTTTKYDSINNIIHFLIVNTFSHIKLEVELSKCDDNKTEIKWNMVMTSINESGNSLMNDKMLDKMNLMLMFLSDLLRKYCENNNTQ